MARDSGVGQRRVEQNDLLDVQFLCVARFAARDWILGVFFESLSLSGVLICATIAQVSTQTSTAHL
jgi:hypothetical protein